MEMPSQVSPEITVALRVQSGMVWAWAVRMASRVAKSIRVLKRCADCEAGRTHQTQTESGGKDSLDVESEHRLFLLRKVCELFESCLVGDLRRVGGLAFWYISNRIG